MRLHKGARCAENSQVAGTGSAHIHVVSGVSSCYAVKSQYATKDQSTDEPTRQSRKTSSFADLHLLAHRQDSIWAMKPPTLSSSHQETYARHDKACAHGRVRRQYKFTTAADIGITDEQEAEELAGNAQECDEPTSSCRKASTQAHEMR